MPLPPYLFWLEWIRKRVLESVGWIFLIGIVFWVPFLRVWWWLFLPFILQPLAKKLCLWYLNWDFHCARWKWVVLEIIPPKQILTPFKAMEDVFSALWSIWDHPNFREEWCEGELNNSPFWLSWEIASLEGKIHFYVRCLDAHRTSVEIALYTHYPEIEIREVPDYTKMVPSLIPNDEWDVYGEDWEFYRKEGGKIIHAYPCKTYRTFFEPQGERIGEEEKRLDPILSLLEGLSKLGKGEYYWIQFITVPIADIDEPEWKEDGKKIVDKIAKRPQKVEKTFLDELKEVFLQIIVGPQKEGEGYKMPTIEPAKSETGEREMLLTPGEREIISEIENKMNKIVYRTHIRGIYVAKRESWKHVHRTLLRVYMGFFATRHLNSFGFNTKTRPKIHFFMRKRLTFLRARKMFKYAVARLPGLFPDRQSVCAILSTEELATLFHFPLRITGMGIPSVEKIESKKGGPPPNLPG